MGGIHVVGKERCPECAKRGKDKHGDNLAVYSDGHTYCFSCGYHTASDKLTYVKARLTETEKPDRGSYLPFDADVDFLADAIRYLAQYELDYSDIIKNKLLWSKYYGRILFPVYSNEHVLLLWQARSIINDQQPKWLNFGDVTKVLSIKNFNGTTPVILVEDQISQMKLAKAGFSCCCLFGSQNYKTLFNKLHDAGVKELVYWLDPDKRIESIRMKREAELNGFKASAVISYDCDPKDVSLEKLNEIQSWR